VTEAASSIPTYRTLARWVAAAEVPVLIAIAPALWFPTRRRLLVLLVVPILWACAKAVGGPFVPRTPLNAAISLLLVMVGVSLAATFDPRFSVGKVAGVVLGVLLFWAVARWVTTPDRVRWGTAVFVLAGAALAVIGLLGASWMNKFPLLGSVLARLPHAIRGIPGAEEGFQPNAVAGVLVLFVPLQVALLLSGSERWWCPAATARVARRWCVLVQAGLLILTAGTLLLTQCRGAWVGILVAGIAVLGWHSTRSRVVAAAMAGAIGVLTLALGAHRMIGLAMSRSGPRMADNVFSRTELWSRALFGIQDFPWTGMGMNAFRKVMPVVYPSFLFAPSTDVAHAHNHLLQAALDLGVPGLVAYLAMWMVTGALLVAVYRHAADRRYRAVAGGLGAGLIAHFMFGMTDAIPLGAKVGVLFWLTLAFAVALHRVAVVRSGSLRSGRL
jgi:putative inorganic carbon (HCO3(-)) transporter